jgi:thiamine pyrophosphate-dependent acetolactate synthase large subunit-like protein
MAIERMLTEAEPVGELIGRVLHEAGIEYVFGISGGHIPDGSSRAFANTRILCAW